MDLIIIGLAAGVASALTLFSGFGLGTVLMPVFALFFPAPLAVAATAVVHFANNLFKFGLMFGQTDWRVVARFGVPAALAAFIGASLLTWFDRLPPWVEYQLAGAAHEITAVKAVIGLLIMIFAGLELSPRVQALAIPARYLPLGGALSGFFGGLSGNQGALRSAFLIRLGLSKDAFVATGVVSAVIVDASRLLVYGTGFLADYFTQSRELLLPVAVGASCAFAGAVLGKRLLQKVTLRTVQRIVAGMLLLVGAGLVTGLI
ncbi:MAG TPA: sulfite exporter TauE/SafE family protein [Candidatus Contendobacter sp.]|nr:sulfite exporter TauE/SafE family protein [Candidatus Contendobacter sp.]HRZ24835.1 sulfite exporter TauE/SafE family protein [Candidatus Contendobacter sp.]